MIRYLLAAFFLSVLPLHVSAASFDCAKARSVSEILICDTPHLSAADEALYPIYKAAKAQIATWPERYAGNQTPSQWFKENGRAAWRWREANCHDVACLDRWYAQRKALLTWIATAGDRLGEYGLRQVVSLPDGKVLLSYAMATHTRNQIYDPRKDRFTPIRNGDALVTTDPSAPIALRESKGYFEEGGAFWVDLALGSDGKIKRIGSAAGTSCYSKSQFAAKTSFTDADLADVSAAQICVLR